MKLIEQVLRENAPCAHEGADTGLGGGEIWAKCEDCGALFTQSNWHIYREAVKRHEEALSDLTRMNDIIKTQRRLLERVANLSLHSTGEVGLLARKMTQEVE